MNDLPSHGWDINNQHGWNSALAPDEQPTQRLRGFFVAADDQKTLHVELQDQQEESRSRPIPWLWYRARTRKVKLSIACGIALAAILFFAFVGAAFGRWNPVSTPLNRLTNSQVSQSPMATGTATSIAISIPRIEATTSAQATARATATPGGKPPTPNPNPNPGPSPGPQSSSVYYGVHLPDQYLSDLTAFEHDAQKAVSILMWYQQWGINNGYQYFQPSWMNEIRNHGSIPLVTWDPWNPAFGADQPQFALQNIINGNFDAYITKWALASKAWGHPYFLRFAHEMNGNWMPWSELVNGNKPGQFVQAWRHVHDIFTSLGVTNVTWVWSPNIDYSQSIPLREVYPGDAYVDWTAMDGYNWGNIGPHTWETFAQVFGQTYNDILSITSKPLMIAETASTEQDGNKAQWITDGFSNQLMHTFPLIRAVVWFNEDKETDWRIESSPSAQSAFAAAIQSNYYASNSFANLNASPIPAL